VYYDVVFEVKKEIPAYIDLYDFNSGDGDFPSGSVILDSSGNLYSTTEDGGSGGADHAVKAVMKRLGLSPIYHIVGCTIT
jgi:hypothetical protein